MRGRLTALGRLFAEQFSDLLRNRLDLRFYPELVLCILLAAAVWPAGKYLPVEWGYENGPIENLQLALAGAGIVACWLAKRHKPAFRFFSFILFLLMLRETNFGKTIFYPDPEHPGEFLRWDEVPYAAWVDPLVIAYLVFMAVWFFRNRLHLFLADFLRVGRIPAVNLLFLVLSMAAGLVIDKACENNILEEAAELVFYLALLLTLLRAALRSDLWLPFPPRR
ncbi:MAG: hypothetical protein IJS01_12675 [Lentisphaeria bacterium]|nr:hypothetical protein [Lentisphaeria bacterium]